LSGDDNDITNSSDPKTACVFEYMIRFFKMKKEGIRPSRQTTIDAQPRKKGEQMPSFIVVNAMLDYWVVWQSDYSIETCLS
jgi:hypothetical protein